MAGDWIKMRMDLQSHPKVVRILSATGADKFRVIGGLHAVWCVFDTHSPDGFLEGYTLDALDHVIGWPGFSAAVAAVGWLVETQQGIEMPGYFEHNGRSAKRRADDTRRKREARKDGQSAECPQNVRKMSADESDGLRTREEKRRDITHSHSDAREADEKLMAGERRAFDRFSMPEDWEPDPVNLAQARKIASVSDAALEAALPDFILHHHAHPHQQLETDYGWCGRLVKWARQNEAGGRIRGLSKVTPLRRPAKSVEENNLAVLASVGKKYEEDGWL